MSADEFYSMKQAADCLGVSHERVRQLVVEKRLAVDSRDERGRPSFRKADVEALRIERGGAPPRVREAPRTEAQIAVRAFEMFRERKTLFDVMKELSLTPQRVRALHAQWRQPLGQASAEDEDRRRLAEHEQWTRDFEREQKERRERAEREHQQRMRERGR